MLPELTTTQWVLLALGAFFTGLSKTGIAGLGILAVALFALAAVHASYPGVLLAVGALALAAALWRGAWKPMGEPLAPVSRGWLPRPALMKSCTTACRPSTAAK